MGLTAYRDLGVEVCMAAIVDKTRSTTTGTGSTVGPGVCVDKLASKIGLLTSDEGLGLGGPAVAYEPQETMPNQRTTTMQHFIKRMMPFNGDITSRCFKFMS